MSDSYWHDAADTLSKAQAGMERSSIGGPNVAQLMQIAQIKALLAIGQELSAINPQNTSVTGKDGAKANGWGIPVE